jgi:hypothetical protein
LRGHAAAQAAWNGWAVTVIVLPFAIRLFGRFRVN